MNIPHQLVLTQLEKPLLMSHQQPQWEANPASLIQPQPLLMVEPLHLSVEQLLMEEQSHTLNCQHLAHHGYQLQFHTKQPTVMKLSTHISQHHQDLLLKQPQLPRPQEEDQSHTLPAQPLLVDLPVLLKNLLHTLQCQEEKRLSLLKQLHAEVLPKLLKNHLPTLKEKPLHTKL